MRSRPRSPARRPDELAELAEKAAEQSIEQAGKQQRRDIRFTILQATAERYPDTKSGQRANELLHKEIDEATEQKIRISRGYLVENRNVAGVPAVSACARSCSTATSTTASCIRWA